MDSILDKVMSSKEDQEKQDFNALEIINVLLKALSSKEVDVVRRRFGFSEQGKETLETIGDSYNVTRERIRQIESQAIKKIKAVPSYAETIKSVEHLIMSLLNNYGGILAKEMTYDFLLNVQKKHEPSRRAVEFIISKLFNDKIEEIGEDQKYLPAWKLRLTSLGFIDEVLNALENLAREVKQPQKFPAFYARFKKTDIYQQNDQKLTEEVIMALLGVSAILEQNPFAEFGLAEWGLIVPKRMNDRVYLVLQNQKQPMHFQDIAAQVGKVFGKRAYPPTVHNELILNDEYVLVGRGIYALKEWGFKEGIVADILANILAEEGKPMERAGLVDKVLQQRIVKKNTIHLALTDKTRFKKTKDGKYQLAA